MLNSYIKPLKIFLLSLLFVFSISQIFNTPGSPFLRSYKQNNTYITAPLQVLLFNTVLDYNESDSSSLFYKTRAWEAHKYILFVLYYLCLVITIAIARRLSSKISSIDISLYYLGGISLIYFFLSYPYPGTIATPFFLISLFLLIKKHSVLSRILYLPAILSSLSLIVFLPLYLPRKFRGWKTILFFATFGLILPPMLEIPQQTDVSFFNLSSLFTQTIKQRDLFLILVPLSIYTVIKVLRLLRSVLTSKTLPKIFTPRLNSKEGYLLAMYVISIGYALFFPSAPDIALYWLSLISLLLLVLIPSQFSKTNFITINILIMSNMLLVYGPSGTNSLSGVFYQVFSTILRFYLLYYFIYILSIFAGQVSDVNDLKKQVKIVSHLKKLCILSIVTFTFAIFAAYGSPDTVAWAEYAFATAHNANPFYAQTLVDQRYPPLSTVIISAFSNVWKVLIGFSELKVGENISRDYALSTKVSIVVFYFLSALLFLKFSKKKLSNLNSLFIIFTTFSIFIQTQGLADVNIHTIPSLLLAILFLFKKKLLLAGLLMGVTISIKWQPIILVPLFLAHLFNLKDIFLVSFRNILLFSIGLIVVPIISWGLVWIQPGGVEAFGRSFDYLVHGAPMLSGQAINLNWIVTYFVHWFEPARDVSLQHLEGLNRQIATNMAPAIFQGPLFLIFAGLVVLLYWAFFKKNVTTFISGAMMIFFTHHQLNRSAYEKHIFYVALLMLVFYLIKPTKGNRILLILFDLMTIINITFFYGLFGPKDFNRMFHGVDLTVVFSAIYLTIFIYVFYLYIKTKGLFFSRPDER